MRVVVNFKTGQLSNRLVETAYGLARGIEKCRDVYLTDFDDLKDSYRCEVSWNGRVIVEKALFWKIERGLVNELRRFIPHFNLPFAITTWDFKNEDGAERCARALRLFFAPRDEVVADAKAFLEYSRIPDLALVGVHVRRGDYATWANGRFYFDDNVYVANMKALEKMYLNEGRRVQFIVFSNEKLNRSNFTINSPVCFSEFTPVQDHWLMSQCDCLIGPPSTFSLWAAFMGERSLGFITQREHPISRKDLYYRSLRVY